ncbi:MAG: hypothetical protein SPI30_04380 [Prevotella sp.]|nr:hypothetical protein [Prevotella sp.]
MRLLRYGIDTSRWYTPYQRLVRSVPVLGSMSTNHWYDNKTFSYCSIRTPRGGETCGFSHPNHSLETMWVLFGWRTN